MAAREADAIRSFKKSLSRSDSTIAKLRAEAVAKRKAAEKKAAKKRK